LYTPSDSKVKTRRFTVVLTIAHHRTAASVVFYCRAVSAHRYSGISVEQNTTTAAKSDAAAPKPSAVPIATPIIALPNDIPTTSPSNKPKGTAAIAQRDKVLFLIAL
jgi:small neutral amino acid transporter SnatA (MarC family)